MADAEPTYIKETERLLIESYKPEYNKIFAGTDKATK